MSSPAAAANTIGASGMGPIAVTILIAREAQHLDDRWDYRDDRDDEHILDPTMGNLS